MFRSSRRPTRALLIPVIAALLTGTILIPGPPAGATASAAPRWAIADPFPAPAAHAVAVRYLVSDTPERSLMVASTARARSAEGTDQRSALAGHLDAYVVSVITQYGTPTATAAAAAANLSSTVGPYWSSVSGGRVTVSATAGPELINAADVFSCTQLGFADTVRSRAFPAGLPAGATLVVIVTGPCAWRGLAIMGGADRFGDLILLNDGDDAALLAHESGHSIGLGHAKSANCPAPDSPLSQCVITEYGDGYDIMGRPPGGIHSDDGGWLPVNPALMAYAGWVDPAAQATPTGPGAVALSPYQSRTGVRVASVTGTDGSTTFLSYATPIRFCPWAGWAGPQPQGVQIHRAWQPQAAPWYEPAFTADSYIIEIEGSYSDDHTNDLTLGQSWAAPAVGIALSIAALTPDSVTVDITAAADPARVFSPRPVPSAPPASSTGGQVTYSIGRAQLLPRAGSAADRGLDIDVVWSVAGADSPEVAPWLTVDASGTPRLQVATTGGTARIPLLGATITTRLQLDGPSGLVARTATAVLAVRGTRPRTRGAWRQVFSPRYVGGSAWRLTSDRGVIKAPTGFAYAIVLATAPNRTPTTVTARDDFGRLGPASTAAPGASWVHAFTRSDMLFGPVRFTVTGRGSIVDEALTLTER